MYKKIIFILLTILFMSGSCNLDKTASKPIDTKTIDTTPSIPTLTDTTPSIPTTINLVDTRSGAVKFDDLGFTAFYRFKNGGPVITNDIIGVKSVEIKTTDAALQSAGITSLSEAKSMTGQGKIKELIKSLTFTFTIRSTDTSSENEITIVADYYNLEMIYHRLSKDVSDPKLQPKLKIDGEDMEFDTGFSKKDTDASFIGFKNDYKPKMKDFLVDILGMINPENFKKYLP